MTFLKLIKIGIHNPYDLFFFWLPDGGVIEFRKSWKVDGIEPGEYK